MELPSLWCVRKRTAMLPSDVPNPQLAFTPKRNSFPAVLHSVLCIAFLLLCATAASWSQASFKAQLRGTVADTTGAKIPNATVVLTNEATGIALTTKSDAEGRYTFLNLEPASYSLKADAQGFTGITREHLVFRVAQESVLDLNLPVAGVTASVQVTEAPVLLNDANAELGTEVTSRYITEVPLFDRDMSKLVYLTPGVTESQGFQADQTHENFSSNGQRNSSAEIRLDGGLTSTPEAGEGGMNWAHFQPSIEIVQEFKMQTNGFSAEYGSNGGTVLNMITKSGGNTLHGSGYWFGRRSQTDANDWFSGGAPLAEYSRNIYGGSIGGPIIKNRLFYFGHYERTDYTAPETITTTVPTDIERQGDFSNTLAADANGNPVLNVIYNPYNNRQPFPDNKIPSTMIGQLAQNLMALYPEPTSSGNQFHQNNFTKNYANAQPAHQYNARVDWNITRNDKLQVRYSKGYLRRESPSDFEGNIGQGDERNDYNNAVAQYDRTFGSSVFLTVRAGVDRHHQLRDATNTEDLEGLGFSPDLITMNGYETFPQISINGQQGLGLSGYTKTIEAESGFVFDEALSIIKGAHSFKIGAEQRLLYDNFFQPAAPGGQFAYAANPTRSSQNNSDDTQGNGLASFLIDFGSSGGISVHPAIAEKSEEFSYFVMDDWKVTPKLTVNLGLRYEMSIPYNERHNQLQFADFDADTGMSVDLSGGDAFLQGIGLGPTELHGVAEFASSHKRRVGTDANNIAPRVGLAYRLDSKTVVSAGAGVYYGMNPATSFQDQGAVYRKYVNWYPTLDNGDTRYATLEDPFPGGYSGPQGQKYGQLNMWGYGSDANQSDTFRNPEIYQWSVSLQRELPGNAVFTAAYSANRSTHLSFGGSKNRDFISTSQLTAIGDQQRALDPDCDANSCVSNYLTQNVTNPFYSYFNGSDAIFNEPDSSYAQSPTIALLNLLRPYPQFTGDFEGFNIFGSSATYNALQLKYEKRYSNGANIMGSYTIAKEEDNASYGSNGWLGNSTSIQQLDNLSVGEWSAGATDVRHRVAIGGSYELPFGRGKRFGGNMNRIANGILGGWQANGYLTLQSGLPINVYMANGRLADGSQRPNIGEHPRSKYSIHDVVKSNGTLNYFNITAFTDPGDQRPGNGPRFSNELRGDSIRDLDFSMIKNFAISEGKKLELRVESFNLTNTPRFADPNAGFGSTEFGIITGQVNSPRQLQFGAKFTF